MVVVVSMVVVGTIVDVGVGVVAITWSMVVGGRTTVVGRGVNFIVLSMLVVGAHCPRHPHHPCRWSWWGGGCIVNGCGVVVTSSLHHWGHGCHHSIDGGGEGMLSLLLLMLVVGARCPH